MNVKCSQQGGCTSPASRGLFLVGLQVDQELVPLPQHHLQPYG